MADEIVVSCAFCPRDFAMHTRHPTLRVLPPTWRWLEVAGLQDPLPACPDHAALFEEA